MPWEIDYAMLTFIQLKKSKYYLPTDVNITIETELNLSSKIINWNETKLPKEFFIEKYNNMSALLYDYNHCKKIYDDDNLYGCLDSVRNNIDSETDYYISICPDIYFNEQLLFYLIESIKSIKNKYFVITPQICRMWDESWEILTHPKFAVGPHYGWEHTTDIFDVDYYIKTSADEIKLTPIERQKWAGWFDVYSKSFLEELAPMHKDWVGYGGWDHYSMIISTISKQHGYDFQQYRLDGQIVFEYGIGPLVGKEFSEYYKKFIVKQDISEQRELFNKNLEKYIQERINQL
jgi:hypothetical protein